MYWNDMWNSTAYYNAVMQGQSYRCSDIGNYGSYCNNTDTGGLNNEIQNQCVEGGFLMNLLQKYQVSKHLDNLHRRFGEEPFRRESMRLEDIAGPLDEDVAPILEFRAAVEQNDRLKMKRGNVRAQVLVKLKRDWIMEQIVQGKSAPAIAEELDIPVGSLRWYVQKDSELKKVYRMMRGRRGYMSEDTAVKIRKMLSEGYTHAVIIATLHVTPSQVEYQQSKRKAGLV